MKKEIITLVIDERNVKFRILANNERILPTDRCYTVPNVSQNVMMTKINEQNRKKFISKIVKDPTSVKQSVINGLAGMPTSSFPQRLFIREI